jgi:hypothetical protein
MKILFVYPYLISWGGVEKHILELAQALLQRGIFSIILSFSIDKKTFTVIPPAGYKKEDAEDIKRRSIIYLREFSGIKFYNIEIGNQVLPVSLLPGKLRDILAFQISSTIFSNAIYRIIKDEKLTSYTLLNLSQ